MRKRRAISPVLSVVILIAIATVGGGLIFGIQNQFLTAGLSEIELRINNLKIEKDAGGTCYFQASFHNSGSESIRKIHLKTMLDSGEDFVRMIDNFGSSLAPGNSTEIFELIPLGGSECGNFTVSNTYSFRVNASSIDSTFAAIKSVQITNVTRT